MSTNEERIWNYLIGKGLSKAGAAGLMGNLFAESGLSPKNLQNTYEKKLGFTDDSYTAAVDSGSYQNFVRDSAGYGLAQWTFWSRKQNMLMIHSAMLYRKSSISPIWFPFWRRNMSIRKGHTAHASAKAAYWMQMAAPPLQRREKLPEPLRCTWNMTIWGA